MRTSLFRTRAHHRHGATAGRVGGSLLAVIAVPMAFVLAATPASAYWSATGSGATVVATGSLAPPSDVTVPATAGSDVPVGWTPGAAGVAPDGYYVTRLDGETASPACATSPTAPIAATSCTDTGVADGSYRYVVTAVYRSWTAASAASSTVAVASAARLVFTAQPTDTTPDTAIVPAVSVALATEGGAAVAEAGVSVTLTIGTNPADGTLAGVATADTGDDGVATFDDLSIDQPGVGYTLIASSPGLTAATSEPFTVAAPPLLRSAATYSVLAASTVVSTGFTSVSGDLGAGTTVSGFPDGTVGGDIHAGDLEAATAQADFSAAYDDLAARASTSGLVGDLGGMTITPGVFHSGTALSLTGTVTLDAEGDPDAVFVIQVAAALTTADGSAVDLVNGAQASNVFWVVTGAAGTGANSSFSGVILAQGAISLGADSELVGRALSGDAVTLADTTVHSSATEPPPAIDETAAETPAPGGTGDAPAESAVPVAGQTGTTADGDTSDATAPPPTPTASAEPSESPEPAPTPDPSAAPEPAPSDEAVRPDDDASTPAPSDADLERTATS